MLTLQIKSEIERCELLKLEKMQQVIENTRKELTEWWEKCYTDEVERGLFKAFNTGML